MERTFDEIRRRKDGATEIWDFYRAGELVCSTSDRSILNFVSDMDGIMMLLRYYQHRLKDMSDRAKDVIDIAERAVGAVDDASLKEELNVELSKIGPFNAYTD